MPGRMTEHTGVQVLCSPDAGACAGVILSWEDLGHTGDLRALMSRTLCHTQFLSEVKMLTVVGSFRKE